LGDSLLFGGHLKAAGEMPPKILNSFHRPISTEIKEGIPKEEEAEEKENAHDEVWTTRWHDNNPGFLYNVETVRRLKKATEGPQEILIPVRPSSAAAISPLRDTKDIIKDISAAQRTEKWLDGLIRGAMAADKYEGDSDRQSASKALVRLITEEFLLDEQAMKNGGNSSSEILISLFLEMLTSTTEESRIRAFDLLYNLQLHISSLVEHHTDKDEMLKLNTLDRQQAKRIAALGNSQEFLESLHNIYNEMILFLFHRNEVSEGLWLACFKVLIYMVNDRGRLSKSKLQVVDVRMLVVISDRIGTKLDIETDRILSRLLVNMLYGSTRMLDVRMLSNACHSTITNESRPIDAIITRYVKARSAEQRENMFVIIYDYIIDSFNAKTGRHSEIVNRASADIIWFLELLRAINAPYHFVDAFLVTPKNFGERVWNILMGIWGSFAAKVDRQFALLVLQEGFEKLALQYTKLPQEVEVQLEGYNLNDQKLEMMTSLLQSSYPSNKRAGERWLTELLLHHLDDPHHIMVTCLVNNTPHRPHK